VPSLHTHAHTHTHTHTHTTQVRQLHERNYLLRVHRGVFALHARLLEEIAAHTRAFGASDTTEALQLEALRGGTGRGDEREATAVFDTCMPHLRPDRSLLRLERCAHAFKRMPTGDS